jgi:hypothetical protein
MYQQQDDLGGSVCVEATCCGGCILARLLGDSSRRHGDLQTCVELFLVFLFRPVHGEVLGGTAIKEQIHKPSRAVPIHVCASPGSSDGLKLEVEDEVECKFLALLKAQSGRRKTGQLMDTGEVLIHEFCLRNS